MGRAILYSRMLFLTVLMTWRFVPAAPSNASRADYDSLENYVETRQ
jgi:hypothetical protein